MRFDVFKHTHHKKVKVLKKHENTRLELENSLQLSPKKQNKMITLKTIKLSKLKQKKQQTKWAA